MIGLRRIAIVLAFVALGMLMLALPPVKRPVGDMLSTWLTRSETRFDVPSRPVALDASVVVAKGRVTICNRNTASWKDVLVKVTDRVSNGNPAIDIDVPYFARLAEVSAGKCFDLADTDFHSAGWKEIPASEHMNIVRVEMLASKAGTGYFVKDEGGSGPTAK